MILSLPSRGSQFSEEVNYKEISEKKIRWDWKTGPRPVMEAPHCHAKKLSFYYIGDGKPLEILNKGELSLMLRFTCSLTHSINGYCLLSIRYYSGFRDYKGSSAMPCRQQAHNSKKHSTVWHWLVYKWSRILFWRNNPGDSFIFSITSLHSPSIQHALS